MTLLLTDHEKGCVPFKRCRACNAADIIDSANSTAVKAIFDADAPQFEPGEHVPGCSPMNPCANCRSVALLKGKLGEARAMQLMGLLDDSQSLEAHRQEQDPAFARTKDLLMKPIAELELSVRSSNGLKNDGLIYVGDLCQKTEAEMLRTTNFGRASLNEIKEVLASMGLQLGMEFPPDMYPS